MREARKDVAAAISKLEGLRRNATDVEEDLSVTRANVVLQSLLQEESPEQLDLKPEKLKEVQ